MFTLQCDKCKIDIEPSFQTRRNIEDALFGGENGKLPLLCAEHYTAYVQGKAEVEVEAKVLVAQFTESFLNK